MTETAAPPDEQVADDLDRKLNKNKKKTRKKRKEKDDAVCVEAASCDPDSKRLRRSCGSVAAGPGVFARGPGPAGPCLAADEVAPAPAPHHAVKQAVQQAAEPSGAAMGVLQEGCHDGRTWHSHVFSGQLCFSADQPCPACAVPSGLVAAAFTIPPGTSSFMVELTVLKDGQVVELSEAAGVAAGASKTSGVVTATLVRCFRSWKFTLPAAMACHVLGCTLKRYQAAAPNTLQAFFTSHSPPLPMQQGTTATAAAAPDGLLTTQQAPMTVMPAATPSAAGDAVNLSMPVAAASPQITPAAAGVPEIERPTIARYDIAQPEHHQQRLRPAAAALHQPDDPGAVQPGSELQASSVTLTAALRPNSAADIVKAEPGKCLDALAALAAASVVETLMGLDAAVAGGDALEMQQQRRQRQAAEAGPGTAVWADPRADVTSAPEVMVISSGEDLDDLDESLVSSDASEVSDVHQQQPDDQGPAGQPQQQEAAQQQQQQQQQQEEDEAAQQQHVPQRHEPAAPTVSTRMPAPEQSTQVLQRGETCNQQQQQQQEQSSCLHTAALTVHAAGAAAAVALGAVGRVLGTNGVSCPVRAPAAAFCAPGAPGTDMHQLPSGCCGVPAAESHAACDQQLPPPDQSEDALQPEPATNTAPTLPAAAPAPAPPPPPAAAVQLPSPAMLAWVSSLQAPQPLQHTPAAIKVEPGQQIDASFATGAVVVSDRMERQLGPPAYCIFSQPPAPLHQDQAAAAAAAVCLGAAPPGTGLAGHTLLQVHQASRQCQQVAADRGGQATAQLAALASESAAVASAAAAAAAGSRGLGCAAATRSAETAQVLAVKQEQFSSLCGTQTASQAAPAMQPCREAERHPAGSASHLCAGVGLQPAGRPAEGSALCDAADGAGGAGLMGQAGAAAAAAAATMPKSSALSVTEQVPSSAPASTAAALPAQGHLLSSGSNALLTVERAAAAAVRYSPAAGVTSAVPDGIATSSTPGLQQHHQHHQVLNPSAPSAHMPTPPFLTSGRIYNELAAQGQAAAVGAARGAGHSSAQQPSSLAPQQLPVTGSVAVNLRQLLHLIKQLGGSDDQLCRFKVMMDELKQQLPADADQVQWFLAEYEMISTWLERGRMDMVLQCMQGLLGQAAERT